MLKVVDYFRGDTMASDVWRDKYAMKNKSGVQVEETPDDMHRRMAREFGRIEFNYAQTEIDVSSEKYQSLSYFGKDLIDRRIVQTEEEIVEEFYQYFKGFGEIVPQGSVMSNLGNYFAFGSISNCFGIESPLDSYGGIFKTDQEIAQLQKRRGGVGTTLDSLRPVGTFVSNNAKSSTGVPAFMERYSNTTREVAQDGRRGALMLLLHCKHPDIFEFVKIKDDRKKVTGANVSVKLTNEFMKAVIENADFICTFPVEVKVTSGIEMIAANIPYNVMIDTDTKAKKIMKIKAVELFNLISEMAWKNAEPGVAFIDRITDYSPDGVYELYAPSVCNPCGEQWFSSDETCRLIAQNYLGSVVNRYSKDAYVDYDKLYEISYMQQRLGDNLVDLEIEKIDVIIDKILDDPEPMSVKQVEIDLWRRVRAKAEGGRRTGNGFTALGDMIASLGLKYDSDEAIEIIRKVSETKMRAELDATIDMAITRGTFDGHNTNLEFHTGHGFKSVYEGKNSFFQMILDEFPEQAKKMCLHGRRNVSWSTVAPTGTVSLMTQTTSGIEPLFKAYYIRRKKINPGQEGVRVDFTDQNGDKWQEYAILHPQFKEWINLKYEVHTDIDEFSTEQVEALFKESPWYGSQAEDISWEKRIQIQSIVQKYTSNAISSTLNLPEDVSLDTIKGIYFEAWKQGLKGVTVYREGSRSGVLISTEKKITTTDEFGYNNAPKRPTELEADYYCVTADSLQFGVIVGLLNGNPYELFAYDNPLFQREAKGKIVKVGKNSYTFKEGITEITNIQLNMPEKNMLTRWVSLLLRHGANPKYIIEQVDKSNLNITSFAKAITRVLKRYVKDSPTKELCPDCNQPTMIYEEGCKKCTNCGNSKC